MAELGKQIDALPAENEQAQKTVSEKEDGTHNHQKRQPDDIPYKKNKYGERTGIQKKPADETGMQNK